MRLKHQEPEATNHIRDADKGTTAASAKDATELSTEQDVQLTAYRKAAITLKSNGREKLIKAIYGIGLLLLYFVFVLWSLGWSWSFRHSLPDWVRGLFEIGLFGLAASSAMGLFELLRRIFSARRRENEK